MSRSKDPVPAGAADYPRPKINRVFGLSVLLLGVFSTTLLPLQAIEVRMPRMEHVPVIDGTINKAEWGDAFQTTELVDLKGVLIDRNASGWIGTDGTTLFVALKTETPPGGELIMTSTAAKTNYKSLERDDTLDIWLMPLAGEIGKAPRFQTMVNPLGSAFSIRWDSLRNSPAQDWHPNIVAKSSITDGWWHYEAAIPLSDILDAGSAELPALGFRLARNWTRPSQLSSTEKAKHWYDHKETMSHLQIDQDAPFIKLQSLGDWRNLTLAPQLEIRNAGDQTMTVEIRFAVSLSGGNPLPAQTQEIVLAAKESRTITFEQALIKASNYTIALQVTSDNGREVWYSSGFGLQTNTKDAAWTLPPVVKKEVRQLDVAYSPYLNKISARILANTEEAGKRIRSVVFEVRMPKKSQPLAWADAVRDAGGAWKALFDVPDFPDGVYELHGLVKEKDGTTHDLVQTFERRHFEWEHNRIGYSDEVQPPFRPLGVEGRTVSALNRDYQVNDFGLLDQVVSEGHPLLTGPMEIHATGRDGKIAWGQGRLAFLSQMPTEVVTEATWGTERLKGRTTTRFDYDGLLEVEIELSGPELAELKNLRLEIPLADGETPLMSAIGARFWGNYAGKVPAGEGVVWNNSMAMAYGYPNNFIPYLWMGGPRRGLVWCADSDSGWAAASGRPMITIERRGNTAKMVLHFISESPKSDEPRKIRFALQATPVKPRASDWRSYSLTGPYPNAKPVTIVGSGGYQGHLSSFADVYPRDQDYRFTKKFVEIKNRGKTVPEDEEFLKKWLEGYPDRGNLEYYSSHSRHSLFEIAPTAGLVIPYMNPRGARSKSEEYQVFKDEWKPYGEFVTLQAPDSDRFDEALTEPVLSFQDFALWYWRKSAQLGFVDGIYFDNVFLYANPNPFSISGPGVAFSAKLNPSVGLMAYRQMARRTYVMLQEESKVKPPLVLAHMTNAAIIPVLSWCTMQLDWELGSKQDDFQDRYTPDYILASSTGEQAGVVPFVLSLISTEDRKEASWLTRTLFGCTMVHEIKVWPSYDVDLPLLKRLYGLLFEFGYSTPDCRVYRYWETPPFSVNRPDVKCLLLEKQGQFLLIATDYGDGGTCEVKLDSQVSLADWNASDAESGEEVLFEKNTVKFDLPRHDFKIIHIRPR